MSSQRYDKIILILVVCTSLFLSLLSFALWPVFLIQLRYLWSLSNVEIGLISGSYFIGYVIATPILVGLTDKFDAKWIFILGCFGAALGNLGFVFLVDEFWEAIFFWTLVGAGLAGTYMPGLQILNSRLNNYDRISAVPWYTSCFGLGTGGSYFAMGLMLANFDYRTAALLSTFALLISIVTILLCVNSKPMKAKIGSVVRHPFDFRPVFKKRKSMSYILAYGAHTYELFAYRSWSVALFFFLGNNGTKSLTIEKITIIISLIMWTGMIASVLGAKLAQKYNRHNILASIGLSTFFIAIIGAIFANVALSLAIAILWFYNFFIMLDSGALTAGAVESSDPDNRGAVLAVHSMVGFTGGALGGPLIGMILDFFGGESLLFAWQVSLTTMGLGSLVVFLIQIRFRSKLDRLN
ncbi:MAG: MFS transporter [Rhodobacteraceae bacterium]|nr:MAG: MFS transporter [Paracoccaceae bacterium]